MKKVNKIVEIGLLITFLEECKIGVIFLVIKA